jgi:hypothetical protein
MLVHNRIFANIALSPKTLCFTPRFRRKRYISLRVFAEMHNFASSLNTLYIAESAQCYSAFLPTTISLTPRLR